MTDYSSTVLSPIAGRSTGIGARESVAVSLVQRLSISRRRRFMENSLVLDLAGFRPATSVPDFVPVRRIPIGLHWDPSCTNKLFRSDNLNRIAELNRADGLHRATIMNWFSGSNRAVEGWVRIPWDPGSLGELAAVADAGGGVDLGWGGSCVLVKVEGRSVSGCRVLEKVEGRSADVGGDSRLPDGSGGVVCSRGGGGGVLWLGRFGRIWEEEDGIGMGLGIVWVVGLGIGPRVKGKRPCTWRVGIGVADGPRAAKRRRLKNLSISSWRSTRLQVQETVAPALGE